MYLSIFFLRFYFYNWEILKQPLEILQWNITIRFHFLPLNFHPPAESRSTVGRSEGDVKRYRGMNIKSHYWVLTCEQGGEGVEEGKFCWNQIPANELSTALASRLLNKNDITLKITMMAILHAFLAIFSRLLCSRGEPYENSTCYRIHFYSILSFLRNFIYIPLEIFGLLD